MENYVFQPAWMKTKPKENTTNVVISNSKTLPEWMIEASTIAAKNLDFPQNFQEVATFYYDEEGVITFGGNPKVYTNPTNMVRENTRDPQKLEMMKDVRIVTKRNVLNMLGNSLGDDSNTGWRRHVYCEKADGYNILYLDNTVTEGWEYSTSDTEKEVFGRDVVGPAFELSCLTNSHLGFHRVLVVNITKKYKMAIFSEIDGCMLKRVQKIDGTSSVVTPITSTEGNEGGDILKYYIELKTMHNKHDIQQARWHKMWLQAFFGNIQVIVLSSYLKERSRFMVDNIQLLTFDHLKQKIVDTDGLKFTLCVLRDLLETVESNTIEAGKSYMLVANTQTKIARMLKLIPS